MIIRWRMSQPNGAGTQRVDDLWHVRPLRSAGKSQLAEWTGFGHLTRSSRGRDILNTPQVLGLVVVLAARFAGVPRSQLLPRSQVGCLVLRRMDDLYAAGSNG